MPGCGGKRELAGGSANNRIAGSETVMVAVAVAVALPSSICSKYANKAFSCLGQ